MVVVVLVSETHPVLIVQTTSWPRKRKSGCRAMAFPRHIAVVARVLHLAVAGQNYSPWWIAGIAAAQGAVLLAVAVLVVETRSILFSPMKNWPRGGESSWNAIPFLRHVAVARFLHLGHCSPWRISDLLAARGAVLVVVVAVVAETRSVLIFHAENLPRGGQSGWGAMSFPRHVAVARVLLLAAGRDCRPWQVADMAAAAQGASLAMVAVLSVVTQSVLIFQMNNCPREGQSGCHAMSFPHHVVDARVYYRLCPVAAVAVVREAVRVEAVVSGVAMHLVLLFELNKCPRQQRSDCRAIPCHCHC